MKEFKEKLIGRLEEYIDTAKAEGDFTYIEPFEKAKNAVNQLAEEYNNGWIPCSEKLPDDFMSMAYLTTVKGHFYPEVNYYCVANHKWYSNERTTKEVKVIAWMPLPVAFRKGE